jgi:hypothetical protein
MAKRKLSVSEIASIIESEGLGNTIQHEVAVNTIKDEDLSDMWARAKALLAEIEEYVEDNADSVDDSDDRDEDGDAPEEDEY